MTHKIDLRNDSALLLVSVLSSDGWAASVADIHHAGSLLATKFDTFDAKRTDSGAFDREWLAQIQPWEFTEKQRETIKKAINTLAKEKKIPVGIPSYHLLLAFGLAEE